MAASDYPLAIRRRVTCRQENGDDGFCYAVRVDGRLCWDGLSQREVAYYREREMADLVAKLKEAAG